MSFFGLLSKAPSPMITEEQFIAAVTANGYAKPTREKYNALMDGLKHSTIADKRELAMFVANILHESGGLVHKVEMNPPPGAYKHPEIDKLYPGKLYYGRGYIMLTWSYNYKAASEYLYNKHKHEKREDTVYKAVDTLLSEPDLVAKDEQVAWDTAFWFWDVNVHGEEGIKEGKFGASIAAINGDLECPLKNSKVTNTEKPKARFEIYKKVYKAFGVDGTPDERGCYN